MSTLSGLSIILSSEQYRRLIEQLRVWCSQDRGRQQRLATRLGTSKQTISAWLSESRMMSLNQYFEVLSAIEQSAEPPFTKDPMSTSVSTAPARQTSTDDDPIDYMSTEKHASWGGTIEALGAAQEEIIRLRATLTTAAPPSSQVSCQLRRQSPRYRNRRR
jgi:hypothetical protein